MKIKTYADKIWNFVSEDAPTFVLSAILTGFLIPTMLYYFFLETLLFCFGVGFLLYQINAFLRMQRLKEQEKILAFAHGIKSKFQKVIPKHSASLSLPQTDNHGYCDIRHRYATDISVYRLTFERTPDAVALDTKTAEQLRRILNTDLFDVYDTEHTHIYGDTEEFPIYVTKICVEENQLFVVCVTCSDKKTYEIIMDYDKRVRDKIAREREQMQQALLHFKL